MRKFLWLFSEDRTPVIFEAKDLAEAIGRCVDKRVELAGDPDYDAMICIGDFEDYDILIDLTEAKTLADFNGH